MDPEFEARVRQIFRLICRYGKGLLDVNPATGRHNPYARLHARHAAFRKAQELITAELLSISARRKEINDELKSARRNRQNGSVFALVGESKALDYAEAVTRKLADSIAWQLICGRKDVAQYLYISESPPNIDHSNFESVKEEVDRLNNADRTTFALASDLTSFVQIGDILAWSPTGLRLIEVKEGEFSVKALEAAGEVLSNNEEPDAATLTAEFGSHGAKQIGRVYRQMLRGNRAEEIINTGRGHDPQTGMPAIVSEPTRAPATYESELTRLLTEADEQEWGYTALEDCLLVGCYSGKWLTEGPRLLMELSGRLYGRRYPLINKKVGIKVPMADSIFLKPFTEDQVFDIVSGRTCVYVVINYEGLIELFRRHGVRAEWLTRRETAKLNKEWRGGGLLMLDNRAIVIQHDASFIYLTDAAVSRIVFDNMLPSSLAAFYSTDPLASSYTAL